MKIVYIANARLPTEKAHGIQIMQMCAALADLGHQVELIVPARRNPIAQDVFSYYGLARNFIIRYLPTIDISAFGRPFFGLQTAAFSLSALAYLWLRRRDWIFYTRGEMMLPLVWLGPAARRVFAETHIKPDSVSRYRGVFRRIGGLITVTRAYTEELIENFQVEKTRVITAPDGFNAERYSNLPERKTARRRLGLPENKKIVVYTGSDLAWKGLGALKSAAPLLPDNTVTYFVGPIAPPATVSNRAVYTGYRPPQEIPLWLASADVLVLTGTATSVTSMRYTSPLKLFEYLAAGRPIMASDVAAFRDILDERTAVFVRPDSAEALAEGLEKVLADSKFADQLADSAKKLSRKYSWDARARLIVEFIASRTD